MKDEAKNAVIKAVARTVLQDDGLPFEVHRAAARVLRSSAPRVAYRRLLKELTTAQLLGAVPAEAILEALAKAAKEENQ